MRPLLLMAALFGAACHSHHTANTLPVRPSRDTARVTQRQPVVRDTALEQRAARLELKVLEQEAQVDELQSRLDDARHEVVRAMAKLQSLATRAEAASGMAEAEIAREAAGGSVAYAYVDQWVRIRDDSDRPGWIHQTLVDRRQ